MAAAPSTTIVEQTDSDTGRTVWNEDEVGGVSDSMMEVWLDVAVVGGLMHVEWWTNEPLGVDMTCDVFVQSVSEWHGLMALLSDMKSVCVKLMLVTL